MNLTAQDMHAIVESIRQKGIGFPWWQLIAGAIIMCLAGFSGAYFAERGKQRALGETAKGLTQAIKQIETFHAANLELFKGNIEMRNARAVKTLQAHQEAYALWMKLFDNIWEEDTKLTDVTNQCRDWWANNCLFLTPTAREEFMKKVNLFWLHRQMRGSENVESVTKRWAQMESLGSTLVQGVELPKIDERSMLEVGQERRPEQLNA